MAFMWEALTILFVGYVLLRIAGKKTVSEMTGLEIITLLAMASMIGHAVSEQNSLWKTIIALSIFVALLVTVQYVSVKFHVAEKWFMGQATLVIKDGQILEGNLKKLRMSVDQLEAKMREKGITSFSDVKTGTIEMSGQLGYELEKHAKPVTFGQLEKMFPLQHKPQPAQQETIFDEVIQNHHKKNIPHKLK